MATALFVLLLCSWNSILCDGTRYETATAGESIHLECWFQVSENEVIKLVEWKKPDLKSEKYVFCFKDNHFNGNYQHPLFHDRVELRDPEMKNGNFSVVLKNVTVNDSGTYECRVRAGGEKRVKRHKPEPINIVELTVREPLDSDLPQRQTGGGDKGPENKGGGDMRVHPGLTAACVMMMMMVVN